MWQNDINFAPTATDALRWAKEHREAKGDHKPSK